MPEFVRNRVGPWFGMLRQKLFAAFATRQPTKVGLASTDSNKPVPLVPTYPTLSTRSRFISRCISKLREWYVGMWKEASTMVRLTLFGFNGVFCRALNAFGIRPPTFGNDETAATNGKELQMFKAILV